MPLAYVSDTPSKKQASVFLLSLIRIFDLRLRYSASAKSQTSLLLVSAYSYLCGVIRRFPQDSASDEVLSRLRTSGSFRRRWGGVPAARSVCRDRQARAERSCSFRCGSCRRQGRRSRRKGPCSPVFCGAAFGGGCFAVRLPGIDRLSREERPLRHVRHTATLPASLFAGACAPLASRAVRPLLPMPVAGVPSTFSDGIQQSSGVGLYPPAFQLFEFGQNHSVQQPEEECGLSRTQILD